MTANPYVAAKDAPIGVNVYMSDAGFPPVKPQKLNTTLRVAKDGTIEVDVPFNQEIFTLQKIGDGADLRVKNIVRGGKIAWANLAPNPLYPDRITLVTAVLGNHSGEYTFGGAMQYPVPLQTEKHWDVHLNVDFASAVRQVSGDFSQTYRHAATGAEVTVAAEAGDPKIPALTGATLTAKHPASDPQRAERAVAAEYVTMPEFETWELGLAHGAGSIDLSAAQRTTVKLPAPGAAPTVMRIADGKATLVSGARHADGTVTFETEQLGLFALVDTKSATRWEHTKAFASDLGTTMTYRTTGEVDWEFPGMDFASLDSLGAYSSYLGEETDAALTARAGSLAGAGFTNPDVRLFTFGFDLSYENVPGANVAKHQAWANPLGGGKTSLSASVPVAGPGSKVFLVSGTVGGGLTAAEEISAQDAGSSALFDIVAKDTAADSPAAMIQVPLWNAAAGKDGTIDTAQSAGTQIAYIAVVRDRATPVAKPVAAQNLVYTGAEQTGVPAGSGYALSARPSATDAGSYLARATLLDGFVWEDGSTEPVSLPWQIGKATLTASYAGERIDAGATPLLAVTVTGFLGADTAENAAGFTPPKVRGPEHLTAGGSYELTPAGGAAANYRFEYVGGTLTVTDKPVTEGMKPGTYRVTANLFVPGEKNDILGVTAYMTNPKNPLVAPDDPNYGIPTSPVRDNARLVVGLDGTRTLLLDVPNPAFTLVELGAAPEGVTVVSAQRDGKAYGSHTDGRITRLVIELGASDGNLVFAKSGVYAAPLQLDKRWDLSLAVDFASAHRLSDVTEVPDPEPGPKPVIEPGPKPGPKPGPTPVTPVAPVAPPVVQPTPGTAATQLAPGNYVVSSNIWLTREATGLPLSPHLTNGAFPPKDPVTGNATLSVATDGTGRITVPIVIQDRIMTVRSLSGGGIVSTSGGNAVTSVTVDLGRIDPSATSISRSMTAAVTIGDLAYSIGGPIFGGTREHTWPASFEVTLAGVPTSGGGIVPGFALAKMPGAQTADEQAALQALESARAANEKSKQAARAGGEAKSAAEKGGESRSGIAETARSGTELQQFAIIAGVGLALALAAGTVLLLRRRGRETVDIE